MEQIAGSLVVFFQVTSGGPDFVDSKKQKKVLAFYYEIHDSWLYLCIYIYVDMYIDVWKMGQSVNGWKYPPEF